MSIFTRHPYEQGVSYYEHLDFAAGIAWRLFRSALAFAIHALLPFITIKRHLDLEATSAFLLQRNRYIEAAALNPVTVGLDSRSDGPDLNTSAA